MRLSPGQSNARFFQMYAKSAKFLIPIFAVCVSLAASAENISEEKRQIVTQASEQIADHYVNEAARQEMAAALLARMETARFANLESEAFAEALTELLRELSRDIHMRVLFDPTRFEALRSDGDIKDEEAAYWLTVGRKANFGVGKFEWLPGQIGYLEFNSFWTGEQAYRNVSAAAELLQSARAIILDLRRNKGGESDMVRYLVSFFIDNPESILLSTLYDGMTGKTTHDYSVSDLPVARLTERPLFVLISDRTFSAGEAFAEHVRNFELGTLVGTQTAGAAHTVELIPLQYGYVLSLSTGRSLHAVTNEDWEGKGVTPHVLSTSDEALEVAIDLARKAIEE